VDDLKRRGLEVDIVSYPGLVVNHHLQRKKYEVDKQNSFMSELEKF